MSGGLGLIPHTQRVCEGPMKTCEWAMRPEGDSAEAMIKARITAGLGHTAEESASDPA